MKYFSAILLIGVLNFFHTDVLAQYTLPKPPETGMKWSKEIHDFGKIPQNKPAKCTYVLTNTGTDPLILTYVKGACGCTTTNYSKEPVPPGESTTITATFDARKEGAFHKSIRVETNRNTPRISLEFKGTVVPAASH